LSVAPPDADADDVADAEEGADETGLVRDLTVKRNRGRYSFRAVQQSGTRRITAGVLRVARERPLPDPLHPSTHRRRARVLDLWTQYCRLSRTPTAKEFAASLAQIFAPSTTLSYMVTAAARIPTVKKDPGLEDVVLILKQEVARQRVPRTIPTTATLAVWWRTQDTFVQTMTALQYVTASRHADIAQANLTHTWQVGETLVFRIEFPVWKSDRTGALMAAKFAAWRLPKHLLFMAMREWPTYGQMWQATQGLCTPHDLRRIAVTELSQRLRKTERALALTAHAVATQGSRHVRRYTTPNPRSAMATEQIRMTQILWNSLLMC
jgi:hypothetical protein